MNQSQTEMLLNKLFNEQKNYIFKFIEDSQCGMRKLLFLLYLSNKPLCLADIASELQISMARVTVLLQKLEKKDLVVKEMDAVDKRKFIIKLTESGIKEVEEHKNEIYKFVNYLVDKIGYDKLFNFIDSLKEINHHIEEYCEVEDVKTIKY